MSASLKAIIFDFDGTLAATMEDNFKAWQATVAGYGLKIKPEDYYPYEGLSVYQVPVKLFGIYQKPVPDIEELVQKKEKHYREHHRFEFYPEVEAMVAELRQNGIRLGIVTASLLERLRHSIPSPDFLKQFDALVTGEETREGKPSPEPYLKGLAKLGLPAEACLAVENAPLGIQSAKRAGLDCIGISSTMAASYLADADEVVASFADLRQTFRKKGLLPQAAGKKR